MVNHVKEHFYIRTQRDLKGQNGQILIPFQCNTRKNMLKKIKLNLPELMNNINEKNGNFNDE